MPYNKSFKIPSRKLHKAINVEYRLRVLSIRCPGADPGRPVEGVLR